MAVDPDDFIGREARVLSNPPWQPDGTNSGNPVGSTGRIQFANDLYVWLQFPDAHLKPPPAQWSWRFRWQDVEVDD